MTKSERLKTERVIKKTIHITCPKIYSYEFAAAMGRAAMGAGLKSFIGYHYDGGRQPRRTAVLVGFEGDIARMELLIGSLALQLVRALDEYGRTVLARDDWATPSTKWNARRSFIMGYGTRLQDRIAATRRHAATAAGTGTELALRNKDSLIVEWIDENMRTTSARQRQRQRQYGYGAMMSGKSAADRADIGQSRFGEAARGALGQ